MKLLCQYPFAVLYLTGDEKGSMINMIKGQTHNEEHLLSFTIRKVRTDFLLIYKKNLNYQYRVKLLQSDSIGNQISKNKFKMPFYCYIFRNRNINCTFWNMTREEMSYFVYSIKYSYSFNYLLTLSESHVFSQCTFET